MGTQKDTTSGQLNVSSAVRIITLVNVERPPTNRVSALIVEANIPLTGEGAMLTKTKSKLQGNQKGCLPTNSTKS